MAHARAWKWLMIAKTLLAICGALKSLSLYTNWPDGLDLLWNPELVVANKAVLR